MNPLAWIPVKDWLYLGTLAVALASAAYFVHHEREIGAEHERLAVKVAEAAAAASTAQENLRISTKTQESIHATETKAAVVAADAASASSERDALRLQLAAVLRARPVPDHPAAGGVVAPAPDVAALFADLFGRATDRAISLAAEADRRGVAGFGCEGQYGALSPTPPSASASQVTPP